jgi:hypothetical protein
MSSQNDKPAPSRDVRRFFRMDDVVHLSYQLIPKEQLAERLEQQGSGEPDTFTTLGGLSVISQQASIHLHRIEADAPDVAAYLKALDRKIELLGRAFLMQDAELGEQSAKRVNISASGIALHGPRPLEVGSVVEIKLLLPPAMTAIHTFGEVVACEESDDAEPGNPYTLRFDFTHMQESDRELLIRHMLRRQGTMLRESRENRESSEGEE